MLDAFEGRCRYCSEIVTGPIHRDHRVPLARKGGNNAANIVPACATCNTLKSVATEDEYVDLMARVAGVQGYYPPAASQLHDRLRRVPQESREVTLLLSLGRMGEHSPFAPPIAALVLSPPPLEQYGHNSGELWLKGASEVRASGTSHRSSDITEAAGVTGEWAGWGYLLPEPANKHDKDAVRLMAYGRFVGYVPAGRFSGYRQAATKAWRNGRVPVVRTWVWAKNGHVSARAFLPTRCQVVESI